MATMIGLINGPEIELPYEADENPPNYGVI